MGFVSAPFSVYCRRPGKAIRPGPVLQERMWKKKRMERKRKENQRGRGKETEKSGTSGKVEKKGGCNMKRDDAEILREVQKNTEMAMKAIDTISDKVYDDDLAVQLSRQSLKYSEIHNKALDKILEGKAEPYRTNNISQMMLVGGIHSNTLFNTSTSHIAEVMIQGSNRGITDMCKALNHHERAGSFSLEIAKELMDFEEKNIERLKKYL